MNWFISCDVISDVDRAEGWIYFFFYKGRVWVQCRILRYGSQIFEHASFPLLVKYRSQWGMICVGPEFDIIGLRWPRSFTQLIYNRRCNRLAPPPTYITTHTSPNHRQQWMFFWSITFHLLVFNVLGYMIATYWRLKKWPPFCGHIFKYNLWASFYLIKNIWLKFLSYSRRKVLLATS